MKIVWLGSEQKLECSFLPTDNQILIMNRDTFSMGQLKEFAPDIVIERELNDGKSNYEFEWTYIARELPNIKRAMWFIDTHVAFASHLKYAHHFQYIFLAINRYVPIFQNQFKKAHVYWLPLCFPLVALPPMAMEKKYKASFVGRWNQQWFPERTKLVEELKQNKWFHAITDYNKPYQIMSESDISFNRSIGEDMNFRVFEALACGTELVTNWVADIDKIKGLKNHLHIYKKDGDAVSMVKDIVSGKRKYKANRGSQRDFIRKSHLLHHRFTELLKMVENNIQIEY